jgi:hypothetical protein
MKQSKSFTQIVNLFSAWLIILVIGISPLAPTAALAAQTAPDLALAGTVSGQVTLPNGTTPIPAGTIVRLYDPGQDEIYGRALDVDPATGAFSFPSVPNGLYLLRAVPPVASSYTPSMPKPVMVFNAAVNVGKLKLTDPQLSGTIFAPDGTTPTAGEVWIFRMGGLPAPTTMPDLLSWVKPFMVVKAPTGVYKAGGLPAGFYVAVAWPKLDGTNWYIMSDPATITILPPPAVQVKNFTLKNADLYGLVKSPMNVNVEGARVVAQKLSGAPMNPMSRSMTLSDKNGRWALGNLSAGSYRVYAMPPFPCAVEPRLCALPMTDVVTVTVPAGAGVNPITLKFPDFQKTVTGKVQTNQTPAVPVFHALVKAQRLTGPGQAEALTDASGNYSLTLAPGLWALTVESQPDSNPADWVYNKPPQLVHFRWDKVAETRIQDFTVVVADSHVTGLVQMPDGSTLTITSTINLRSDEGVGVRKVLKPSDPAPGAFNLAVPNGGYKALVHPSDPRYLGPVIPPFTVVSGETYDLGQIKLLAKDAVITGTLTSNGNPVAGIPVTAWRDGVPGSLKGVSGLDGEYAIPVAAGTWHVQPAPGPESHYLYLGSGTDVTLTAGQKMGGVDFTLSTTDATIIGQLVDATGKPVTDVSGWASAVNKSNPAIHNGAPIQNGTFTILVPAGTYTVRARLSPGSDYTSAVDKDVTVAGGATQNITLTVLKTDAQIWGELREKRTDVVVTGVGGLVTAWQGTSVVADRIDKNTGAYSLNVAPGLWHENFWIDPTAPYIQQRGPINVPVESGQSLHVPLPVLAKDGRIHGTVTNPSGSPVAKALVVVRGAGPTVKDLVFRQLTDASGNYAVKVPFGHYKVSASAMNPAWIAPVDKEVDVPQNGNVTVDLKFRIPDAVLSGSLTVQNAAASGQVFVWAWSDDGARAGGRFPVTLSGSTATGTYSLNVTQGTTWHLKAVMENKTDYWVGKADVAVNAATVTQNLTLTGPNAKPAPVVVTFDAASPQEIDLADGTHIFIPGGALPASGMVTLRIVPIAALPHQQDGKLLHYGYAFLATDANGQAIEAKFNQNVVISFKYSEAELRSQRIYEAGIKPVYYSTTTNTWTEPVSYVVDTEKNTVEMEIDHFTDYALVGDAGSTVYAPLMSR